MVLGGRFFKNLARPLTDVWHRLRQRTNTAFNLAVAAQAVNPNHITAPVVPAMAPQRLSARFRTADGMEWRAVGIAG